MHDVLRTLRRRFPVATVYLAGVPVEGTNAPIGIIEGLKCVVAAGSEVVLVVRGGGSFEDMMPFNDEALARAIAACPVPVVTGIGHEVDTSIADMVSDLRASTPTAAAEAVSPSVESLDALFSSRAAGIKAGCARRISSLGAAVENVAARPVFADPMTLFAADAQALDIATERLSRALPASMDRERERLKHARERMQAVGPRALDGERAALATAAARLEDLSPLGTLARGYSITRDAAGDIVRSVLQAPVGSTVKVAVADGSLACEVVSVEDGVGV